ncbi:MFS transporter [Pontivivens insulae]|uniref:Inner membrane protein YbjJ n=1 Tax=Pontivivens insulae TaxID=1639689 RepID=A0A2R8AC17_9RHOB|nr:MFS transporter [Pontivivens insulae]RED11074.1 fucose permease [Pontivivens insulae]SPF29751.1 Inner membrane protein YbjJ [Pontivivens insulae]
MTTALSPRIQASSLCLGYVAAGFFWGGLAASMPDLKAISALGAAGFGWLMGAITVGGLPALLISGFLMRRFQPVMLPASLALFGLACLILSRADGAGMLGVALGLAGAASGGLDIALNMRISILENAYSMRLFNLAHGIFTLSVVAAAPLAGAIRAFGGGVEEVFTLVALSLALAALIENRAGATAQRAAAATPASGMQFGAIAILLGLIAAAGAFSEQAAMSWTVLYLETLWLVEPLQSALAPAAFMLGMSGGRFIAHMIELRIRAHRILLAAGLIGGPAFLLLSMLPSLPVTVMLCAIIGIAVGPVEPTVFRMVSRRMSDAARGPVLAGVTALAYVGYLTASPLMGTMVGGAGWAAAWTMLAIVLLCVILLVRAVGAREAT